MGAINRKTRNQKSYIIEEVHNFNILLDTREIFIHGTGNEDDSGIDYRIASTFLKNVRLLENMNNEPIIIHQYTIGGDCDAGMLVFDIIKQCSCHVILIMHGVAASMGSIIPQAADTRVIMPNCTFMIHYGNTGASSDLTTKQSNALNKIENLQNEAILDIYASVCQNGEFFTKTKSGIEDIKRYIRKKLDEEEDWYLLPKEVVEFGFADGIYGSVGYEDLNTIRENV